MGQPEINDSFIKELYIQDHELEFLMEDGSRIYYSCEDCKGSQSILLHGLPREGSGFLCEGDVGEQPVKRGVNTFSIRITEEGTVVREYMISVVVKSSPADVTLKALLVDDEEAVIAEGADYYYYQVDESCAQAEVEAIPSDPKAVVEGDLGLIDLETGMNFLLIRVYSANHSNKASYQLAIERKSGEKEEEKERADVWQTEVNDRAGQPGEKILEFGLHSDGIAEPEIQPGGPYEEEEEEQNGVKKTDRNLEKAFENPAVGPDCFEENDRAGYSQYNGKSAYGGNAGEGGDREAAGEAGDGDGETQYGVTAGETENAEPAGKTANGDAAGKTEYGEPARETEYGEAAGETENGEPVGKVEYGEAVGETEYGEAAGETERGEPAGETENGKAAGETENGEPGETENEEPAGETEYGDTVSDEHREHSKEEYVETEYGDYESNWGIAETMAEVSSESRLSDLKVEGCRLKPEFSPDIFDYKVDFQGEIDDILVEAVPMSPDSTIEGDLGIQVVVTGYNAFSVLCTAQDGITKTLYKYSVEKKKAAETNVGKKSSLELKEKKREYRRQVWIARFLKMKAFLASKTQKKSTMSQSQKLGAILLLLLCANYPVYLDYTKPVTQKRTALETESAQVSERRRSIEERLSNKEKTVKSIDDYKGRLQEIGDRYPYFPSQEEILYYMDNLQKKVPVTYTAAFIGEPTVVQSSDILNDITAKNIGTVMGDLDLLTPPDAGTASPSDAAALPDTGNGQAPAEQPGHFRKNVLTLTLQGSKDNVLQAYEQFIKDQRFIVTDEMQLSKDAASDADDPSADGRWSLSFNAYYYQYTSLEERSYRK